MSLVGTRPPTVAFIVPLIELLKKVKIFREETMIFSKSFLWED